MKTNKTNKTNKINKITTFIFLFFVILSLNVNSVDEIEMQSGVQRTNTQEANLDIALTTSNNLNDEDLESEIEDIEETYNENLENVIGLLDDVVVEEFEKEMIVEMFKERYSYMKSDLIAEYRISRNKEFVKTRLNELYQEQLISIKEEMKSLKMRNLERVSNRIEQYKEMSNSGYDIIEQIKTMPEDMIVEMQNRGEITRAEVEAIRNDKLDELKKTIEEKIQTGEVDDIALNENENNQNSNSNKRNIVLLNRIENRNQLRMNNFSLETDLDVELEESMGETKVMLQLNNGRKAEIKIMPQTASQVALNRLKINAERFNQSMEIILKEVGNGNESRAVYNMKLDQEAKLFGFIKTKMNVEVDVDAQSSEIVSVKNPWWAFLAKK
ncbi:MAG: hypothetical protein PHT94_03040 [Candidatus Nanoarchaeia archaeon]|nr:hypothetical protein [Candidatus Nanoarchaeia archaeon]